MDESTRARVEQAKEEQKLFKARQTFNARRAQEKRKGAKWELTFEQWKAWWDGKVPAFYDRKRYAMVRINPELPYRLDNITLKARGYALNSDKGEVRPWTPEERKFMADNWGKMKPWELAVELNRSVGAVMAMKQKLVREFAI